MYSGVPGWILPGIVSTFFLQPKKDKTIMMTIIDFFIGSPFF